MIFWGGLSVESSPSRRGIEIFDIGRKDRRLYLVTDRGLLKGVDLVGAIAQALEAGVRMVQLREKDLGSRELLSLAKSIRELTMKFDALLLINDRVDIALLSGADGVHLGQDGFSPLDARKVLGGKRLIGVSAHGVNEALIAQGEGADFITLGPVYPTPSKAPYGEPIGAKALEEVTSKVDLPVYAIGGIKKGLVKEVLEKGAFGVAVISAVLASEDIGKSAGDIIKEIEGQSFNQRSRYDPD